MNGTTATAVDVAVGVVVRGDGAVLLGQRPAGKPYAGWWEFPGGKFEPGETPGQALARELHEELGLDDVVSAPWIVREHLYPHARVRLHFRRVTRWHGDPQSRELQSLVWQHPDAIRVAPLLPAAIAPIGWLRLPALYGLSCAAALGAARFVEVLDAALARGLRLVQLREPQLADREFAALFGGVRERCRAHGARLLVSSRHDASYWHAAGGVHLTARDLAALRARPSLPLVAASCHAAGELALAAARGCDFAVLGPVMSTASHPQAEPVGWDGLQTAIAATPVPVYALGGLAAADLERARASGAHGVAMLRAAW